MKYKIRDIKLTPLEEKTENESLLKYLYDKYRVTPNKMVIHRKSLDARKQDIVWVYTLIIEYDGVVEDENIIEYIENNQPQKKSYNNSHKDEKIIIIGSGPAGLFCALKLAENGKRSIILERGKPVSERIKDIKLLEEKGILDVESNVVLARVEQAHILTVN